MMTDTPVYEVYGTALWRVFKDQTILFWIDCSLISEAAFVKVVKGGTLAKLVACWTAFPVLNGTVFRTVWTALLMTVQRAVSKVDVVVITMGFWTEFWMACVLIFEYESLSRWVMSVKKIVIELTTLGAAFFRKFRAAIEVAFHMISWAANDMRIEIVSSKLDEYFVKFETTPFMMMREVHFMLHMTDFPIIFRVVLM